MIKNSIIQKLFYAFAMMCIGFIAFLNILKLFMELAGSANLLKIVSYPPFLVLSGICLILLLVVRFLILKKPILKLSSFTKVFKQEVYFIKNPILFGVLLCLFSFGLKVLVVLILKTPQYSDYKLFYYVTDEIARLDLKYIKDSYFGIWAYQVGFPTLMAPFYALFGYKILPLIVLNCGFMAITNGLLYLLARQFVSEKVARISAIVYMLLPFMLTMAPMYTNQHVATMFFYLGLYVMLKDKKFTIIRSIVAGLLFAIGNMARPEAVTILLAFIVLGIMVSLVPTLFKKETWKILIKKYYVPITTMLVIYWLSVQLISQMFVTTGLNPSGLVNNFPLYKFVVGLNYDSGGQFSKADADYLFSQEKFINNPELRNEEAMKIIQERLQVSPATWAVLLFNKVQTMWVPANNGYPAFLTWDYNKVVHVFGTETKIRNVIKIPLLIDLVIYILVFGLSTYAVFCAFKEKENSQSLLLLSLLYIIVFGVYLFIEVQHRYSYFALPLIWIIAASGLDKIVKREKRV